MSNYKVKFKPDVAIYHDPCMDGFTAAYAVWSKYTAEYENHDLQLIPANHSAGKDDEEYWVNLVTGKNVVILDFSFERDLLLDMHEVAENLVVLDHHKSAEEKLGDLEFCHFRQDISGALLAWHAFFDGKQAPYLYQYVSDRDLWKWELPKSKEINTYIQSIEKDFKTWMGLELTLRSAVAKNQAARLGRAMLDKVDSLVNSTVNSSEIWRVAGRSIIAVNSCELQSEVCHALLSYNPVAGCYSIFNGKMRWSLRGNGSVDVSEMAGKFAGGGGHKDASGFTIAIDSGVDFVNKVIEV